MNARSVRIGCGAAFWGDSAAGPAQLVHTGAIDYLVLDYLAEITMSLLARAKARRPEAGYASDFVSEVLAPLLPLLAANRIKVVANAGGVNPLACVQAVEQLVAARNLPLQVAAVLGDDLVGDMDSLRAAGVTEMTTGAPLPAAPLSANAYLGATPIAAALDAGADIVITGRCVDSALVLGPLLHEFQWASDDYDRLAGGSLAGHIIECGTQCTGGLFTDWDTVPGWDDMGYPVAECAADGSCVITKPPGTGGLVTPATVAEQIVYEIGDPARYVLPDVVCDFSQVALVADGPDRVRVSGARGLPPTATCKVSITHAAGYRATAQMMIGGIAARAKALRVADAILARCRRLFGERGFADFSAVSVEALGAESTYGAAARTRATREVILKIGVAHEAEAALELFAREIFPAATAMAPGITGFAAGRPTVQPVVRLFSCLVDKHRIHPQVVCGEARRAVSMAVGRALSDPAAAPQIGRETAEAATITVPLVALAHGRSGDKGNSANIGLLARRPEFIPVIRRQVTAAAVREWFAHAVEGTVECFEWPGLGGFNFVLHEALGGGGVASLRHDPQGKAYAQMLLDFPVQVPACWTDAGGPLGACWTPAANATMENP